uniref:Uncharacterized protein n=1 Tax=Rhizophora mucronata TaxID=61149 RepID=A0A2P2IP61_RHIMU
MNIQSFSMMEIQSPLLPFPYVGLWVFFLGVGCG